MNFRFIITITIISVSLATLVLVLKSKSYNSVIQIVDLKAVAHSPQKFYRKEIRMRGFVQSGSIIKQESDKAQFIMEQDGSKLSIHYTGKTQLPDTFIDGAPIRVDGYLQNDKIFLSSLIEAKCASKYEAPQYSK